MARETIEHRKACECDAGTTLVEAAPNAPFSPRRTPVCDVCGTEWKHVKTTVSVGVSWISVWPERRINSDKDGSE